MKAKISHERLLAVISYDPETGIFIWKKQLAPRGKVGAKAGCLGSRDGYVLVRIDGILYRAHVLAWFYMTGSWPKNLIDHKNMDRSDNSWQNLRGATYSQNFQNGGRRKNNKSGVKGVCWDASRGKWLSQIAVNGRHVHLGRFDSKDEAATAYAYAAYKHFGEFARVA